jgi:hypothetical protein
VTITITGEQVWTVAKYALAFLGGAAAMFVILWFAFARAFERFWG